jgi:hypothetical protein
MVNRLRSRPTTARVKSHARSRVTNGQELLPGIDGRSLQARRYRDLVANLVSDAGGIEIIAEARLQLIRRFSALAVLAENLEAKIAMGEDINLAEHCVIGSTLVRLASRLGINRNSKNVTPVLRDYLEAKATPAAPARSAP